MKDPPTAGVSSKCLEQDFIAGVGPNRPEPERITRRREEYALFAPRDAGGTNPAPEIDRITPHPIRMTSGGKGKALTRSRMRQDAREDRGSIFARDAGRG